MAKAFDSKFLTLATILNIVAIYGAFAHFFLPEYEYHYVYNARSNVFDLYNLTTRVEVSHLNIHCVLFSLKATVFKYIP